MVLVVNQQTQQPLVQQPNRCSKIYFKFEYIKTVEKDIF